MAAEVGERVRLFGLVESLVLNLDIRSRVFGDRGIMSVDVCKGMQSYSTHMLQRRFLCLRA